MLDLLMQWYENSETIAIVLAFIVVPHAYFALNLFVNNHAAIFDPLFGDHDDGSY